MSSSATASSAAVFISYVSEDVNRVDRLVAQLAKNGVSIWLDRDQLKPGQRWKAALRSAIQEGSYFIACFSEASEKRARSYMREELTVAVGEIRQRPHDRTWFIPIKLDTCQIPDIEISVTETLRDLQYVDLQNWNAGIKRLLEILI